MKVLQYRKRGFDLLAEVKRLCGKKGLNPGDYEETLREANGRRWGASSLLRKDGYGIDVIFDEFSASYPWMYESLDDFVEALANRLARRQDLEDRYPIEDVAEVSESEEKLLIDLMRKPHVDRLAGEWLENQGLVSKEGRRVYLSSEGILRLLERAVEETTKKG